MGAVVDALETIDMLQLLNSWSNQNTPSGRRMAVSYSMTSTTVLAAGIVRGADAVQHKLPTAYNSQLQ